jgi:DNA repair protein RadA/Sms
VAQTAARLKEAQKLGFGRAVIPEGAQGDSADSGLALTQVSTLQALVADIAATGMEKSRSVARMR